MPLDEAEQRRWKGRLVADALTRLAGLRDFGIDPVRSADPPLGYRTKVELTLGLDAAGRPAVGFHSGDPSRGLVDVPACPVQGDPANAVLVTARCLLLESNRPPEVFDGGFRLVLRAAGDGKVLCAIRESGREFPDATGFAAALCKARPEVVGVVRIKSLPGRRGGSRTEVLQGNGSVRQRIGGIQFVLPAATFTQINAVMGEELIRHVVDAGAGLSKASVFDLYGGVGVLGLSLARGAASVTVCEADREAVRCGREAARKRKMRNVTFVHQDVGRFLAAASGPVDLAIANPPREGLRPGVAAALAELEPARVLMVSCDPPTMARDVRLLIDRGYGLDRVTPFDMFPQTAHIETVALLSRRPSTA